MAESVTERRKRVVSFVWLVLFVGAGAFFSVLLTQAVKDRQRHEAKHLRVAHRLQEKEAQVGDLRREQEAGMTDPVYVEGLARRELNYAKPGEESYRRENVKLQRSPARDEKPGRSPLLSLVEGRLAKWQIPLSVLAVVVIALLIIRGFGPEEESSAEEAT